MNRQEAFEQAKTVHAKIYEKREVALAKPEEERSYLDNVAIMAFSQLVAFIEKYEGKEDE